MVTGLITTRAQNGIIGWPCVTRHESGVDTMISSAFGLPFDLHTYADLAAITWPDIPEFYRGFFGWKGDTIPNLRRVAPTAG